MPTPQNRIYRICAQCLEIFDRSLYEVKRGGGVFCSKKCRIAKQSADRTAKGVANLVPRVCVQCFKSFKIPPSRLKPGQSPGLFCSRMCDNASRAERKVRPEIKFWKYVNKTEDCWLWTGGQIKGYGQISVPEKKYSHRFSWEMHNGSIPTDTCVLHRCDVPLCVRPDHLFLGTHADNTRDRIAKRRGSIRFITAFGETKHMSEWLRDVRCLGTYDSITQRLNRGFTSEFVLTIKPLTNFESGLCRVISAQIEGRAIGAPAGLK